MRIGLNGQKILIDQPAGPELYTINLFRALAKVDRENEYVVYFDREPLEGFFEGIVQGNENFSYRVLVKPKIKFISWTQLVLAWELIENPVDVFFTAIHTLPVLPTLLSFGGFKAVSMIHGLEYKKNREYEKLPFRKAIHPLVLWWTAVVSKKIIVPSEATKKAILAENWTSVDENKITVVHEGVNDSFYKRDEEEIERIREKYNLGSSNYLLFISTIQPRKNVPGLIAGFSDALEELKDSQESSGIQNTKLALVGKKGWMYQESYLAPKKYGVEDNVAFLGRVSEEDLPVLLSGTAGFVSTSFEEGFGLPLLEAMACETPAVVSDIAAFREVGWDYPIYVDPNDRTDIKKGLVELLKGKISKDRIAEAKNRADEFTWEKTAQETLGVLKDVK